MIPPYSLSISLTAFSAALVVFALRMRSALRGKKQRRVNPFAAVRLLAAARSGQCVGALLGGVCLGLLIIVLCRSVVPAAQLWLPIAVAAFSGGLLTLGGLITEHLCKVPPSDHEDDTEQGEDSGPEVTGVPGYTRDWRSSDHFKK